MATAGMATLLSQHPLFQSGSRCSVQSSRKTVGAVPFSTRLHRTGSRGHNRIRMEASGKQESVHFQKPSLLHLSNSPVILKRTNGEETTLPFATVSVVARQPGLPPPAENEGLVTEAGPIGILDPDNKELWLSKVEWVDPRVDIDPVSIRRGARLQLRTERQLDRPNVAIAALSEQHSKSDNLVSSVRKALPPSIRDQPWAMPGLSAAVLLVLALIWTLFRKKDEIQEKGGVSTPYGNSPPGGAGVVKKGDRYSALQKPRQEVSYKLGQGARKTEELVSRFVHKTERAVEKVEDVAKDVTDEAAKKTKQTLSGLKKGVDKVRRSDDKVKTTKQEASKAAEKGKAEASKAADKTKEAAEDVVEDGKKRVDTVKRSDDKVEASVQEVKKVAEKGKEAAKDAVEEGRDRVEESTGRSGTGDSLKAQVEAPKSAKTKDRVEESSGRSGTADSQKTSRGFWDVLNRKGNKPVISGVKDAPTKVNEKLVKAAVGDPAAKLSAKPLPEKTSSAEDISTDTTPPTSSVSDTAKTSEQSQKGIVSGVEGSDPKALESLVKSSVGKPSEQQPDSNGKPSSPPFQAKPTDPTPKAGGDSASKDSVSKPSATKIGKNDVQKEFEALSKLVGEPEKTDSKQESMQTVVSELSQAIEQSKQALLEPPADEKNEENTTNGGRLSPSARFAQDIAQRFTGPRPPVDVSKFAPKPKQEDDLDDGPLSPSLQLARDIRLRAKEGPFFPTRAPPEISKSPSKPKEEEDNSDSPSAQLARDIRERAKSGMPFPTSPPADFSTPQNKPAPKEDDDDDNNDDPPSPTLQLARDIKQRAKGGPFFPANPPDSSKLSQPSDKPGQEDDSQDSPSLQLARDIKQRAAAGPFFPASNPANEAKSAPKKTDGSKDAESPKGFFADILPWARKSDVVGTTPTQPLSGTADISVKSSTNPADVIGSTPTKPADVTTMSSTNPADVSAKSSTNPADVSMAPGSNGKPSEAAKPGSNWWEANRAKPAEVISQTPTTTIPAREIKPSPIASAASQAPTKPVTVVESKPPVSASKPSSVTSSSSVKVTSKATREDSNGASSFEDRTRNEPAQIVEKIFFEDLPLPKLSGAKAALRRQLVAKLQNVLPAVAVSIGAAGALTGGIDGALETVGFTALASFATSTLLWASSRQNFKKELEGIKSSKDLREFVKERAD